MKTFLAWREWSERTILTSLGLRLLCFLLLFIFNLGFGAIYLAVRRVVIDTLRAAGTDNSLVLPVAMALQHGLTWTMILYVFVFFVGLLQIACMRHLIVRSAN